MRPNDLISVLMLGALRPVDHWTSPTLVMTSLASLCEFLLSGIRPILLP